MVTNREQNYAETQVRTFSKIDNLYDKMIFRTLLHISQIPIEL